MIITYLILGTNMGDRFQNLGIARSSLQKSAGTITGNSSVYETEPWGFETGYQLSKSGNTFRNTFKP